MPPKRPSQGGASSGASSASSSGSSGSSSSGDSSSSSGSDSGSSSSSSDSDDDGDSASVSSAASRASRRSRRSSRSGSRSSADEKAKAAKAARKSGASTRSRSQSASSVASVSSSDDGRKKKGSKQPSQQPKVAPRKSATVKPVSKATAVTKKSQLASENDNSEDSDFGDFSLPKLAAKAKQAKKAAASNFASASTGTASASSSASNTPKPNATPTGHTPTPHTSAQSQPAANKALSKAPPATSGSASSKSKSAAAAVAQKYKSIFSDTSGSDSDPTSHKKPSATRKSPSPPKLTPQKKGAQKGLLAAIAPAVSAAKSAAKKTTAAKPTKRATRSSSVSSDASSASSVSSNLSKSSDSSDSEVTIKSHSKISATTAAAMAMGKKKGRPPKVVFAPASAKNKKKKAGKTTVPTPARKGAAAAAAAAASDDSEPGSKATIRPTTRQSRSNAHRRSKHVTGRGASETDSEGVGGGYGSGGSSPRKKPPSAAPKMPSFGSAGLLPVRRDLDKLPPIETRKCPVPGCDSSGHLGGKIERHFLVESCPVYHHLTRKLCRDFRQEIEKKINQRKKAMTTAASKSPLSSPTPDQQRHLKSIKDARFNFRESASGENDEPPEDREIDLKPFASDWDLKLFREAQALASEDLENSVKGLPDAMAPRYVDLGKFEMETWYQSQYPEDYATLPKIYICEFCLKYMKSATVLQRHAVKCVWKHPPGIEIYRKDKISVFEICGERYKQYCQNLCLLAKFFLDHKTLYLEVEPFLFYVMTTADTEGCHIVGYFSKEKNSVLNYNVSCILTLPPYQRQGYGKMLIDFSYLLSKVEGKIGSPEKPLSDLGLVTYRAYWKDVILDYMCKYHDKEFSIKNFSEEMGIHAYDIVSTLQFMGMIKYWKGQHVILKKEGIIKEFLDKNRNRPKTKIDMGALRWKPYEPTAKERRLAEQIKKRQEERQKKRVKS